ncbi:MAG: N-acetylmuramic acid 6-phosphate etherase [Pseudomonadota bacterium]
MPQPSDQPAIQSPIDSLAPEVALAAMLASHQRAAEAVAGALAPIARAAEAVATCVEAGGTLLYAAAGSSGLMALSDACELPGTFRIPEANVRIEMAGGIPVDARMPGDTEDDTASAARATESLGAADVVIVLSASGTTPYACAVAQAGRARGSTIVAIANVATAPLLDLADIAIAVPTAPEVVGGSTRLGAGTAQKIALNMLSTQAGALLGHIHDGLMVNVHADNAKLRNRARDIVATIADVAPERAAEALGEADFDVKTAVLLAAGASPETARLLLDQNRGRLRKCLNALTASPR